MRTMAIAILLLLSASPALADMESLEQFLRSAEAASQVTVPLRGDGRFDITSPEALGSTPVAVIIRPPADMFIELGLGIKAQLLSPGEPAYLLKKDAAKAETFPLDASFAESDFTRQDLEPFRLSDFKDWRISDDGLSDITVTLFPKSSQYSLVVMTFDREKKVPLKTLYYRETLNNLVKMRRDNDYVLVGRKWMPTVVSMETFKLRTSATFTFRWSQSPSFPPELFDPAFLPRPSGIVWPDAVAPPRAGG